MRFPRVALPLVALGLLAGCFVPSAPDDARVPHSMAAIGDSLVLGVNVGTDHLGANPGYSWATGTAVDDGVLSHFERLVLDVPALQNHTVNLGRSGARMADFARQAEGAVEARAEYVTVLLGANDACRGSLETMTSPETFRAQFRAGARILQEGLPEGAVVYVASVPDIAQIWDVFGDDETARSVWSTFRICQALLAEGHTPQDRAAFDARVAEYNRILAEESAAFGFITDGGALAKQRLAADDLSPLDYFHPSLKGQARLAQVTWEAGPLARLIDVAA